MENSLTNYEKKLKNLKFEVHIVLEWTFGNEGKSYTTKWLIKKALDEGKRPCVIKFNSGPRISNAAVVENVIDHSYSSFGSGVSLGVPTFICSKFNNSYIDPILMKQERDSLSKELGIQVDYPIWTKGPSGPMVITPMDREFSQIDGGMSAVWKRYKENKIFGISDINSFLNTSLWDRIIKYYEVDTNQEDEVAFFSSVTDITEHSKNSSLYNFIKDCDVVILEGSYGLLLDMDCGFYPHVLPSRTGLNGLPTDIFGNELFLKPGANIWLATRINYDTDFGMLGNAISRHRLDNYKVKYKLNFNMVITHNSSDNDIKGWKELKGLFPIIDREFYYDNNESKIIEI